MLDINTKILHPWGYSLLSYLSPLVGVIDRTGGQGVVSFLSDTNDYHRGFLVNLSDGSSFIAGEEVLLYTTEGPLSLKEIYETKCGVCTEEVGTIYFRVSNLDVPPYWGTAFIGNGDIGVDPPEIYLPTRELWSRMQAYDNPQHQILFNPKEGTNLPYKEVYSFQSRDIDGKSELFLDLENLWSGNPYPSIPLSYQHATYIHRINAVRGLMDTMGCVNPMTGAATILIHDKKLLCSFVYLVRSLGGVTDVFEIGGCQWQVDVYLPNTESPFSIGSKAEGWVAINKPIPPRKVMCMEPISAQMREIKADSFVLNNFVTLGNP